MRWSKIKKSLEESLADSLKGHIKFHVTRYGPGLSYSQRRAWITCDKKELVNMSNANWLIETNSLKRQIRQINRSSGHGDPKRSDGHYLGDLEAEEIAGKEGTSRVSSLRRR